MGFFSNLKMIFRIIKDAPKIKAAMDRQRTEYVAMTTEELSVLPDEALFSAVLIRTQEKIDFDAHEESFAALSLPQKVLYALNLYEAEVNNGGLCQFFVNSSRMVAPYISEYLEIIGSDAHKQLFDGFIQENGIDVHDLSSFKIQRMADYEMQTKRYPFDNFDNAFYALPSLEEALTAYIKKNLSCF